MYRIDLVARFQAPFIAFALINGLYTSLWDIVMDWSLGSVYGRHRALRQILAFRNVWVYYAAMVVDVVVRNEWIFYAIFYHNIQHSALLAFILSFAEVCRRGLWTIFRVENEHCTNVLLFRASRDVPLPYDISPAEPDADLEEANTGTQPQSQESQKLSPPAATAAEVQPATLPGTPSTPLAPPGPGYSEVAATMSARRPSFVGNLHRVASIMALAHAQDFERRKKTSDSISGTGAAVGGAGAGAGDLDSGSADDSSEDEDAQVPRRLDE